MEHWLIVYYLSGTGTPCVGDAGYSSSPGRVFIHPNRISCGETPQGECEKLVLPVNRIPHALTRAQQPIIDTESGVIRQLISQILAESAVNRANGENIVAAYINLLFQYMIAQSQPQGAVSDVKRMVALIHKNVSNPEFRVGDALGSFSLSEDHLRRLFKQETGKSPHEYLLDIRIDRACELLVSESGSFIKEIAGSCGFDDPLYFSRTFRRRTGTPPSQWKLSACREEGYAPPHGDSVSRNR